MTAFKSRRGRGAHAPGPLFLRLICVIVLLLAAPAFAQTADRQAMAFEQARQAASTGRLDEAQALLERLVTLSPDTPGYRLALAEVLMRQGQTDRAFFHYSQLEGAALGPRDRAHVAQRLAVMRRSEGWKLRLSFGLVPQTNVGKRTSADSIDIGGIDFALDAASREQSGVGLAFAAGASRAVTLRSGSVLRFGLQAQGYAYNDRSFNDLRLRASLGLERVMSQTLLLEGGLVHNTRFLADKRFSTGPGLWLGAQVKLSRQSLLTLRGQTDWQRHPTAPGLDGRRHALVLGLRHQASPSLSMTAQLGLDRTEARQDTQSGKGVSLTLGARKQWAGGLTLGLDLTQRQERRDGTEPLFGVRRDDRTTSVTLRASHRSFTVSGYAPTLEITREQRRSTLAPARYRNTSVGIFLSREF